MKFSEVQALTDQELVTELDRLRRHAFDLRSQAVTEKLEDPSLLTQARKDIARLLTELRQRQVRLEAATAEANGEQ